MSKPVWLRYYFYEEDDGEFTSHQAIWAGMLIAFEIDVYAADRKDPCAHVSHPPRKASIAKVKEWFDKHAACLGIDRDVPGLNK